VHDRVKVQRLKKTGACGRRRCLPSAKVTSYDRDERRQRGATTAAMRRARSRPPQDRGREDRSQKGVDNVDAEDWSSKQSRLCERTREWWYHVVDPGAGVSQRSATRDGDGVEDDESEEMTQEDEPNSLKADHLGRPADNGVGRRCSHKALRCVNHEIRKRSLFSMGRLNL